MYMKFRKSELSAVTIGFMLVIGLILGLIVIGRCWCTEKFESPESSKKLAVVCCLTRGYEKIEKYEMLIERNKCIEQLAWSSKYDHVIFHEGNISQDQQIHISQQTPKLRLTFKDIKQTFEREPQRVPSDQECNLHDQFPIGYKRMCRFWFIDFWSFVKDYQYMVRFDEDIHLSAKTQDPVVYCLQNDLKYICPTLMREHPDVIDGLDRMTTLPKEDLLNIPGTHTEIFDVQYYLTNDKAMEFVRKIDESGCIMKNRWGDAPLTGILVREFTPEHQYKFNWNGFVGKHLSHNSKYGY